jgi:hypothetical protein
MLIIAAMVAWTKGVFTIRNSSRLNRARGDRAFSGGLGALTRLTWLDDTAECVAQEARDAATRETEDDQQQDALHRARGGIRQLLAERQQ